MPAGQLLEPSLTEAAFLETSLAHGIRPDGRDFTTARNISVSFGEELGTCSVSIGGTRVQTCVRASLVPPRSERPYEGFLQITTEISPMAGIEYDSGARDTAFDRLVEKAVRRTEAVDREALCVVAGEQVWNIHLTVHLLSDTGSALDAAVLSSLLSLRHFRRPEFSLENGSNVILYSPSERVPVPLAIHHTPLCVSFALFTPPDKPPVALLDPTLLEETLAYSRLTLVLNAQREICLLDKTGGAPIPQDHLISTIKVALNRVKTLTERVELELTKDKQSRVVEVV